MTTTNDSLKLLGIGIVCKAIGCDHDIMHGFLGLGCLFKDILPVVQVLLVRFRNSKLTLMVLHFTEVDNTVTSVYQ